MPDTDLAARIKSAFAGIEVPGGGDLASFSGLSEIIVTKGAIAAAISIAPGMEAAFGPARDKAQQLAESLGEGRKVMISLTADKATAAHAHARQPGPPAKEAVPGIKHIIAVASGKGGVGKSTTAVNLALALSMEGLRVGLLDGDLYGPSVPRLLGIDGRPTVRSDGIFAPHSAFGLKAISIGSMLAAGQAVVWRGPMATAALRQLLRETDWGGLDMLVVDLPPGTGDIQISLCQQVPLDGAVIVSTPQDLALIDAQKAIDMLRRLSVPLLGLVENMSYFVAPDTGNRYEIFGHGGAQAAAPGFGMPFLGAVPLVMAIRETSDSGRPVVATAPDGPEAKAYRAIAAELLKNNPTLRD